MDLAECNPIISQVSNVFENKIFEEVIKLKWGSWSSTVIPCDWCPYKKRYSDYTVKADVKTQQDGRHLQAKQRGSEETTLLTPWSLTSSLQNCEEKISFV